MVYWIVVISIWLVSLILIAFGGGGIFQYLFGKEINIISSAVSLILGIFLNFLVVNWPVEASKKGLDENSLKALKLLAKVAPIAPKAVREGLEKIIEKYG